MESREFVSVFMTLSWASPFGLGALLAGLGVYYWGKSKADAVKRQ